MSMFRSQFYQASFQLAGRRGSRNIPCSSRDVFHSLSSYSQVDQFIRWHEMMIEYYIAERFPAFECRVVGRMSFFRLQRDDRISTLVIQLQVSIC